MNWKAEIEKGIRFKFGENWKRFSNNNLTEEAINEAILCTKKSLDYSGITLKGKRVIDIGCGSGLFTLSALRLGADHITSFDYDPESVECTKELLKSNSLSNQNYEILEGNILDNNFISRLGKFDIVYSWGVLHHTGNLKKALKNSSSLVNENGSIFVALYQKTFLDIFWKIEKRFYSSSSKRIQNIIDKIYILLTKISFKIKGISFEKFIKNYANNRGMNYYRNVSDWLGGYPYEGITTDECKQFFRKFGFQKLYIKKRGRFWASGSACNEYIFKKN